MFSPLCIIPIILAVLPTQQWCFLNLFLILVLLFWGFFLESILSPGTRSGATLHLSCFEMSFKGQKGKERKELHLTP